MAFAGGPRCLTAVVSLELERRVRRRSAPSHQAVEPLAERLVAATGAVGLVSHQEITLSCRADRLFVILCGLKRLGFEQLIDIDVRTTSTTTWLVHHLLSLSLNARVRVRAAVHGSPLPTASLLYANAAVLEDRRHVWDARVGFASPNPCTMGGLA